MVVAHNQDDDEKFGVHPAIAGAAPNTITQPEPSAQADGRHSQQSGEAQEFARHEQQARPLGLGTRWHQGQVHKDARQVEQASKPAGNEDDVEGFDPEHGESVVVGVGLTPSTNRGRDGWAFCVGKGGAQRAGDTKQNAQPSRPSARNANKSTGKKNPSTWAGVVSLFAVTHQGPAQGGKAGDSKLSGAEFNNVAAV